VLAGAGRYVLVKGLLEAVLGLIKLNLQLSCVGLITLSYCKMTL